MMNNDERIIAALPARSAAMFKRTQSNGSVFRRYGHEESLSY